MGFSFFCSNQNVWLHFVQQNCNKFPTYAENLNEQTRLKRQKLFKQYIKSKKHKNSSSNEFHQSGFLVLETSNRLCFIIFIPNSKDIDEETEYLLEKQNEKPDKDQEYIPPSEPDEEMSDVEKKKKDDEAKT